MLRSIEPYFKQMVCLLSQYLKYEFTQPQIVQLILIAVNQLQPLSFSYNYIHDYQKEFQLKFSSILLISRPYLFLTSHEAKMSLFCILFGIHQIYFFGTIALVFLSKAQQFEIKISNQLIQYICNYSYLISSTFYSWLFELCFLNITQLYGILLGLFLMIEMGLTCLIADRIYSGKLVLRVTTQLPINNNYSKMVIKPLRLLQILIFYFLENKKICFNLQNILSILIHLLYIYGIVELKVYAQKKCIQLSTFISTIGLCLCVESLINQKPSYHNLWLLIAIILYYLLLNFKQSLTLITNDTNKLKHLFSIIENMDSNTSENKFQMNLIIQEHQIICQKKCCICYQEMEVKEKILKIIETQFEQMLESRITNYDEISLDLSQILFRRRQFVKAQQAIFKILSSTKDNYQIKYNTYKVSLLSQSLFEFLLQQIENDVLIQMMERMILNNPNNKVIADALKQFSINESSDQQIQQKLKKAILDKSQFYYYFIEHNNKFQGNINYPIRIIKYLQQFRIELTDRYQKFPTSSNQNILKFYLLEVLNDYIEAFELNKNKAFNDEKYTLFHDSVYNKLFGSNPSYLIAEINKDLDVAIVRFSKRASSKFQALYGQKQKNVPMNLFLNDCLPEYAQKEHRKLIEKFLDQGTNKYYQQQNLAFLKIGDKTMLPIEMMVGINSDSLQTFSFIVFFYEQNDYRSYMVVNQNNEIINCSENISNQVYGQVPQSTSYISSRSIGQIYNILPDFDQMINQNTKFFFNQIIRLFNYNKLSHSQKQQDCLTNLIIDKKFQNDNQCFMITLDNIRTNFQKNGQEYLQETSICQRQQTADQILSLKLERMKDELDEEVEKVFPYQEYLEFSQIKKGTINYLNESQHNDSKQYMTDLLVDQDQTHQIKQLNQTPKIFSPKESMDEEFINKRHFTFHQNDLIKDFASGSSVTMVKRSKYYKKFEIIYALCRSKKSSLKIQKININFVLFLVFVFIYSIYNLVLISNVTGFIEDMKLLTVRYDTTGPLEQFSVQRFTQINYKEMLGRGVINTTYANYLQIFPKKYLEKSFDIMKNSMTNVLLRSEIDTISNITYLPVMLYVGPNNTAAEYNISRRSVITITLDYQYDFKLHLTGAPNNFDNPYFYFTYKDYVIIKSMFDNLNIVILDITIDRCSQEKKKWIFGLIPFLGINLLITIYIIQLFYKHNFQRDAIMKYIISLDPFVLEIEKNRLQYLHQLVNNDIDQVKAFSIDIDSVDQQLEKANVKQKNNFSKKTHSRLVNNKPFKGYFLIISHFSIYLAFCLYLFLTFQLYFFKYEKTAIFYQQLSDIGVDIPAIYAQKEILFRLSNRYPFLNSTDINQLYQVIENSLTSLQKYQEQNLNLSTTDYLFDESLINFFSDINTGNLCEYQTDELKQETQSFCAQVMQGNLVRGFQQTLIYILNSVKVQQQDTQNFTVQPKVTLLELEGSTILSDIISTMVKSFYNNLVDQAKNLIFNQQMFCIFYLTFELIIVFIYFNQLNKQNYRQVLQIKQSVYLFPRNTLIFDDSFYRNFRTILNEENLLD